MSTEKERELFLQAQEDIETKCMIAHGTIHRLLDDLTTDTNHFQHPHNIVKAFCDKLDSLLANQAAGEHGTRIIILLDMIRAVCEVSVPKDVNVKEFERRIAPALCAIHADRMKKLGEARELIEKGDLRQILKEAFREGKGEGK